MEFYSTRKAGFWEIFIFSNQCILKKSVQLKNTDYYQILTELFYLHVQ